VDDARLKARYGLDLLAVHCGGDMLPASSPGLNQRQLKASDVLLVQGKTEAIRSLKAGSELLVLDSTEDLPRSSKAPLALLIMVTIVSLAAFGIMPIALSALMGCLALIGTGCLNWQQATRALSVQVILIIVASLALGSALMKTGGADYLAQVFLYLTSGLAPVWVMSFLMLLMAILTNVVSNNAAAVIGGRHWDTHCHQYRPGTGIATGAFCTRGSVRCQPEFCNTHGVQNQFTGDERGWLQI
jgi:hypothetical protein